MAVNDVWRVRVFCRASDQVGLNVWHYKTISETGGRPSELSIANSLGNTFSDLFKNCMSANADFRGFRIQQILPLPARVPVDSVTNAGAGALISDLLPREVTGLISLQTAFAGRRYRGRVYIPFPSEASNDANGKQTAVQTGLLQAIADAIPQPLIVATGGGTTAVLKFVLFHRSDNSTDLVTSAVAKPYWASQRRRGDYGRTNISI